MENKNIKQKDWLNKAQENFTADLLKEKKEEK